MKCIFLQTKLAAGSESSEARAIMSTPNDPLFCLKWNDFESNISCFFHDLRKEKDFSDVTLACGDHQVEAHKVILAASSPFFSSILKKNPHTHPLIYLKGIEFSTLEALLKFIYHGEASVHQDNLQAFLAAAEELKVKGLRKDKNNVGESSSTNEHPRSATPPTTALSNTPHPTAPAVPQHSAQLHGSLHQPVPLARISSAGVKKPVQNNNIDSEVPGVKVEPESDQLEDSLSAEGQGGEHHGPEDYDQEQCSQICLLYYKIQKI